MENYQEKVKKLLSKIRAIRKERGLNQTDIANKLGITQSAYKEIELGNTALKVPVLFQLMEILGTDLKELGLMPKDKDITKDVEMIKKHLGLD